MARGPAYPYVDLEQAIELTRKVYTYTKRSPAASESIVKDAWKYSPTSSTPMKVLAALKYYGLLEDVSSEKARSVKITDRAYRIILDHGDEAVLRECLQAAALSPRWYKYCWETWGKEMPPSMRSKLLLEHHFVESTVDAFIRDYKKTIQYAGLLEESIPPLLSKGDEIGDSNGGDSIKVGDYVQWESNGVLRFPAPRKVIGFSEDGGFAFVEGSSSGVLVEELIISNKPEEPARTPEAPPVLGQKVDLSMNQEAPSMRQDIFSLSEGEGMVTIQWPANISKESFQDIKDWLTILERKIGRSVRDQAVGQQDVTKKID